MKVLLILSLALASTLTLSMDSPQGSDTKEESDQKLFDAFFKNEKTNKKHLESVLGKGSQITGRLETRVSRRPNGRPY